MIAIDRCQVEESDAAEREAHRAADLTEEQRRRID